MSKQQHKCTWATRGVKQSLLVEACLELLVEKLSGHKAVLPDVDHGVVVDGKAQLRQSHVQLIHPTWDRKHL